MLAHGRDTGAVGQFGVRGQRLVQPGLGRRRVVRQEQRLAKRLQGGQAHPVPVDAEPQRGGQPVRGALHLAAEQPVRLRRGGQRRHRLAVARLDQELQRREHVLVPVVELFQRRRLSGAFQLAADSVQLSDEVHGVVGPYRPQRVLSSEVFQGARPGPAQHPEPDAAVPLLLGQQRAVVDHLLQRLPGDVEREFEDAGGLGDTEALGEHPEPYEEFDGLRREAQRVRTRRRVRGGARLRQRARRPAQLVQQGAR